MPASDQASPLEFVATLLGASTALVALAATGISWYRRTLGRRADRYSRLARLGTGAHLSIFEAVLGEPAAIRRTVAKSDAVNPRTSPPPSPRFSEWVFVDRDYYVQAIADSDGTVVAFSITTRTEQFAPRFEMEKLTRAQRREFKRREGHDYQALFQITLGRTKFAQLHAPELVSVVAGAHNHAYSEITAFGNPGYYQTFVFTASDAARQAPTGDHDGVAREFREGGLARDDNTYEFLLTPTVAGYRDETVVTTYTVIRASLPLGEYPLERFGPHENYVRTLP